MARSAFERVIELQLARFAPEQAKALHIEIARRVLGKFLAGQSEKPVVAIEVDGHAAASENQVQPFGIIAYRFLRLPAVGRFTIATAREISPVDSGRYKKSWFLLADGAEVSETAVPANTRELVLSNDQPYARKIHVRGARLQGVPPGIVERVRQLVLRRFGGQVDANIRFITLRGGYQLKGKRGRPRKRQSRALTYPALVITARV
jgi:hypothetical protein